MTLSMNDLNKTERLSYLTIDDEKKETILSQLNDILNLVTTLDDMDLSKKDPLTTVIDQEHYKRDDIAVVPTPPVLEGMRKNAPDWDEQAHTFVVPKIK